MNGGCLLAKSQLRLENKVPLPMKSVQCSQGRGQGSRGARARTPSPTSTKDQGGAPHNNLQASIAEIRKCGRADDLQGALRVFEKLQASGNPLSPQLYNCMIDAHLQAKDLPGALSLFDGMVNAGTADVVTFNTILKALLSLGRAKEARELLSKMA